MTCDDGGAPGRDRTDDLPFTSKKPIIPDSFDRFRFTPVTCGFIPAASRWVPGPVGSSLPGSLPRSLPSGARDVGGTRLERRQMRIYCSKLRRVLDEQDPFVGGTRLSSVASIVVFTIVAVSHAQVVRHADAADRP